VTARRCLRRSEDGQALVLGLVFTTVVFLIVGVLAFAGYTEFASTRALAAVTGVQYAADAAVQEATNALAASDHWNAPLPITTPPTTQPCPTEGGYDANPVTLNGAQVWSYCTYVSDSFLVRNIEITACGTNLSRTVSGTISSTTITLTAGSFSSQDVGAYINTATPGTYIASVTNATTAVLNQSATSSGSWTITDGPNLCPLPLLRAYVILSQQAPLSPVVVTVADWSELYGTSA
jgi:hypothetical protein